MNLVSLEGVSSIEMKQEDPLMSFGYLAQHGALKQNSRTCPHSEIVYGPIGLGGSRKSTLENSILWPTSWDLQDKYES